MIEPIRIGREKSDQGSAVRALGCGQGAAIASFLCSWLPVWGERLDRAYQVDPAGELVFLGSADSFDDATEAFAPVECG
jgi:hypothetical protein